MKVGIVCSKIKAGAALGMALFALSLPGTSQAQGGVGTWTPLANQAPAYLSTMLLLSDGTVMAVGYNAGNDWYRLTPDIHGSYVNGTWSTMPNAHDSRGYFQSHVLRDGRVFCSGAEYGSGGSTSEIYNPIHNTWTLTQPPTTAIPGVNLLDGASEVLPNGNVLVYPVAATENTQTLLFDIVSDTWSEGPATFANQDEATWVKLADDSILTIDLNSTNSERFIPFLNKWVLDTPTPENIWTVAIGEIGAGLLLPNGKAFFLGGNGKTAIYTPSGNTTPGSWVMGAAMPAGRGTNDAPAAMMVNGKILCPMSDANSLSGNTYFYEYDYVTNAFTPVNAPDGAAFLDGALFNSTMLHLPDGSVLFSGLNPQLYVYTPAGTPLAAGKPVIQTVTPNPNGSYHLTGTLFNGISIGAGYGDDLQCNTNYPIARLSDTAGHVYILPHLQLERHRRHDRQQGCDH